MLSGPKSPNTLDMPRLSSASRAMATTAFANPPGVC